MIRHYTYILLRLHAVYSFVAEGSSATEQSHCLFRMLVSHSLLTLNFTSYFKGGYRHALMSKHILTLCSYFFYM